MYNIVYLLFFILLIFCLYVLLNHRHHLITGGLTAYKNLEKYPRTKSEKYAVELLESITGKKFPTAYPDWLTYRGKKLELDGYNEEIKVALEYSGPLHTKWYPSKESYQKYFERITRDEVKKILCEQHGVNLIVIDMSLKKDNWRDYILSRLYDFKLLEQSPARYIEKQTAVPYRNEFIEKELGLKFPGK